jgi:phosphoglycolate phosphatase-like HAD superfamily hydrolase
VIPKWIIVFDWDGTLIESLPLKIQNAGQLFQETFEVSAGDVEAAYRIHSGIPRRQLFDAICEEVEIPALTDEPFSDLSIKFTARNCESVSNLQVEPAVISTLETLNGFGYPLFISTSAAPDEVQTVAKSLELDSYFKEILGSHEDFTKGPVHIDYILNRFPVERNRLWFVGDEPNDVLLGKKAGVRTVARTGSHPQERLMAAQPDVLIESITELIPLLERS